MKRLPIGIGLIGIVMLAALGAQQPTPPARPTPPVVQSPGLPPPPPGASPAIPPTALTTPPPTFEVLAIALKGADARIDALEKRVAALEARKGGK